MEAKHLLGILLPKFVLDTLSSFLEIRGETKVYENASDVTILFCDIADFDKVVKEKEHDILYILDKIVRRFDELCKVHGIQKIETVGKTYMAAAGILLYENGLSPNVKQLGPTYRILEFAKDMMKVIKDFDGLSLKIGIHVGRPVMGVIGYHKPQFSLIGDVVNTTSRHCSEGEKTHIMLSKETYFILRGSNILSRGYSLDVVNTKMKGKGMVDVYHLYPSQGKLKGRIQSIVSRANRLKDPDQVRDVEILERSFMVSASNFSRRRSSFYELTLEAIKNKEFLKSHPAEKIDTSIDPPSNALKKALSSTNELPRVSSFQIIEISGLPSNSNKKETQPLAATNSNVAIKNKDVNSFRQTMHLSLKEEISNYASAHKDDNSKLAFPEELALISDDESIDNEDSLDEVR